MSKPVQMMFTGERFVPELSGTIAVEHWHRYFCALTLVKSKTVLDIASGEGYGSHLLASQAAHVYGVDIAEEAVLHARAKYPCSNLDFMVGDCVHIPLPDQSVDVVVSFETLEHHDQHEESMLELKRVLRPQGLLLISTPDKENYSDRSNFKNEFHVKELYKDEFQNLIEKHFKNSAFFAQRYAIGSVILPFSIKSQAHSYFCSEDRVFSSDGIVEPTYHLALACDGELVSLPAGIFEQPIAEADAARSLNYILASRDQELNRLLQENKNREDIIQELHGIIENIIQELDKVSREGGAVVKSK